MTRICLALLLLLSATPLGLAGEDVQIIISSKASSSEKIAASELAGYLRRLYPDTGFVVEDQAVDTNRIVIRLGTPSSAPDLLKRIGDRKPQGPESYVVTRMTIDDRETGIIFGDDPAGVMFGVFGLLEKLGCGFFISFDTVPKPLDEAFSFDNWDLANRPLAPERIVFNWHNFISGCTSWNLTHWKQWIAQSQKSGFNTIMVHAYGNNPMFSFEFNGVTKEVGYVATTRHGRDWGINHINDIRRGYGGFLFEDPVFGSEAAKVSYNRRVKAKQTMMCKVFEYAQERGVNVNFALDVDTEGANPQNMIKTLAERDRFKVSNYWVARPDTPGGYQYYKAQAEALIDAYPQVTTLTLWRRKGPGFGSIWPLIKVIDMPESWQKEYQAYVAKKPAAARVDLSVFNFALAKVFKAWRRALDELGRREIPIATGSWRFEWLEGAVEFLPEDMKLLPLDYECMRKDGGRMGNQRFIEQLGRTIQPGRVVPIIWAHHDDGAYIGAPLPFLKNFNSKLKSCGAGGFGIIHWMTHPLDPYFTNHVRQTWAATENESSEQTCRFIADRWFGLASGKLMSAYMRKWIAEMPSFARETTERFLDRPMTRYGGAVAAVAGCQERIGILDKAQTTGMTETEKKLLESFKKYERFVADIFREQTPYDNAMQAVAKGDLAAARTLLADCRPGDVVARYAELIRERGATRGEEGLVATMNTRWIPWHVQIRQQAGIEAVRYNFAATSHERLAQGRGSSTVHVTPDYAWWQTLGEKEMGGAKVFSIPEDSGIEMKNIGGEFALCQEIFRTGVESKKPLIFRLAPILQGKHKRARKLFLPPGEYKLTLLLVEPEFTEAGQRMMQITIVGLPLQKAEVDIFKQAGGKNRALVIEYPVALTEPGNPKITLTPVKGRALVCGVVLTPLVEAQKG